MATVTMLPPSEKTSWEAVERRGRGWAGPREVRRSSSGGPGSAARCGAVAGRPGARVADVAPTSAAVEWPNSSELLRAARGTKSEKKIWG